MYNGDGYLPEDWAFFHSQVRYKAMILKVNSFEEFAQVRIINNYVSLGGYERLQNHIFFKLKTFSFPLGHFGGGGVSGLIVGRTTPFSTQRSHDFIFKGIFQASLIAT